MKQNATFPLYPKFAIERIQLPTELWVFSLEMIIGKMFSYSNHPVHGRNIFYSYWKKPNIHSVKFY